jgi:hypothetical protein
MVTVDHTQLKKGSKQEPSEVCGFGLEYFLISF